MLSPRPAPQTTNRLSQLEARIERLGLVLEPNGDPTEAGGILNPAAARAPHGELLLYPRCVEEGNISRVGLVRLSAAVPPFDAQRLGFALEPQAAYEIREHPGYGCEDPRVTHVPVLDAYVMAYTAFGPEGPRIALATSQDAYTWERLGLVRFDLPGLSIGDDKDAAFFPEPVLSPAGVRSLAFYHRPMLHLSAVDGRAAIPMIERMPFEDRESIRIGYVHLDAVLANRSNLLVVNESLQVVCPDANWGSIKIGAGTPPVKISIDGTEVWMALFHGVDLLDNNGSKPSFRYSSGLLLHDLERPDIVLYRSPKPLLTPEGDRERVGVVDNVVFPTGIDPRTDLGELVFDVYYGMADSAIGAARMWLGTS